MFGVWRWGTNLSSAVVSSCWHKGIPDFMLLMLSYCWWRLEPPLIVSFVLYVWSGGFFGFLAFCVPFFSELFPWASKAHLVLAVWVAALLEDGYPGWATSSRCYKGSPLLSCYFFCYSWPLGHKEASKRGWWRSA